MGNSIRYLVQEEVKEIDWDAFAAESTYLEVTGDVFQSEATRDICKSACMNSQKSSIIWILTRKIIESWENSKLSINLMQILKVFFAFVYSEGIPYQFLFQETSEKPNESYNNTFHRLVPCLFYFHGQSKTVYVSVPQAPDYEKPKEQAYLIETIKSHYQEVNDHVMSNNERIYLSDENGKTLDIDDIYRHYESSSHEEDNLKDPFRPQTKVFTIFKAIIQTTECDLASQMSLFLSELIVKVVQANPLTDVQKIQAAVELLLTLMSSQLYYMDKPIDRINYECFKASPVVDILMSFQPQICQQFTWKLLEIMMKHWNSQKPKPGLLSVFYNPNSRYHRESEILHYAPKQAISLLLLLQNYSRPNNPFLIKNWSVEWDGITQLLLENIDNSQILLLLYNLLSNNASFHAYILSLTEPERFLEPMAKFLYTETQASLKCNIILIITLMLTNDKVFMKFINSSIQLQQISWLQNYRIESISLGSCLFLGILRKLRENLRSSKDEYLHVITSSCLYNIAEQSISLHELASMDLLSLIKAIYSKYSKMASNEKSQEEIQAYIDLLVFLIEILSKILYSTYTSNPFLIYSVLHHAELFEKIKESNIACENVSMICEINDYLLPKINSDENIILIITSYCKTFKFNREPELVTFNKASCVEFSEDKEKWEECMVPFIWADAINNSLSLPNKERILLFKI